MPSVEQSNTSEASPAPEEPLLNDTHHDELQEQINFEYEPSPVNAPDGGFGWVIVGAAFFINLIADGISFSFGVLLKELFENLPGNHEEISVIGALLQGMPLILGPMTSVLINRFGCRVVTMAGSVISAAGFALSSFMPSQVFLISLTAGLLSGIGLSMCFMPAVVIVSFYFSKRRAFATGISVSGTGVGTAIFAPMLNYLVEEYSWRGTFLILAGVLLNMSVCAAFYRPLEPEDYREKRKMKKMFKKFLKDSPAIREAFDKEKVVMEVPISCPKGSKSLQCIPTYLIDEDTYDLSMMTLSPNGEIRHSNETLNQQQTQRYRNIKKVKSCGAQFASTLPIPEHHECRQSNQNNAVPSYLQVELFPRSLETKTTSNSRRMRKSTLIDSQEVVSSYTLRRQLFPVDRRYFMINYIRMPIVRSSDFESCPEICAHHIEAHESHNSSRHHNVFCWCRNQFKKVNELKPVLDMKYLFSSWRYNLFWVSNFILYFWYDITYMFLPDHADDIGVSSYGASTVMAVIGFVNMIGQIVIGFIGDDPRINTVSLYVVCLMLVGIANALVPLFRSLWSLLIYGVVYGFLISANYSLCSIVIVDLFSLEKLTSGYGFIMLGQGIANLLGAPVTGRLKDVHGNYDLAYLYSGLFVILSNIILLPIWYHNCYKERQQSHQQTSNHNNHHCSHNTIH